MSDQSIDTFVENFVAKLNDELKEEVQASDQEKQIGFWIAKRRKEKFDRLQSVTEKRFGKKVRQLVETVIDMTDEKVG